MSEAFTRVYLASRYSRREEMVAVRADLETVGYIVTSRWINGSHQAESGDEHTPADAGLMARFATEDLDDLRAANYVISFQEVPRKPTTNRGGRHVEFGYALALRKPIICVGPLEHVFTALPQIRRYDDWPRAFAFFQALSHGTSAGVELTDTLVERLADEAEQGYDPAKLKPRRRTEE